MSNYDHIRINQLAQESCTNEEAFNELLDLLNFEIRRFAKKYVAKYKLLNYEFNYVKHELITKLWESCLTYKPIGNFLHYAATNWHRHFVDLTRKECSKTKFEQLFRAVPNLGELKDYISLVEEQIDFDELINNCSEKEGIVLKEVLLNGKPYRTIYSELPTFFSSHMDVARCYYCALEKVKKKLA